MSQTRTPQDCTEMVEVRQEIDRIDARLVELIAERFGYVDRAWQIKSSQGKEGALVPWRIQEVVDRVREQAESKNLPPELAEALWRQMIGWFVQYEEEQINCGAGAPQTAPSATPDDRKDA
ncbi:MAG: chorismate mutase [Pseudomonadota bacterium]